MTGRMNEPSPIRILLAEDEEAMRTYLARALENAGYAVVAVDLQHQVLQMERFRQDLGARL
jgi:two-component system cell cycle response regulator CpdR